MISLVMLKPRKILYWGPYSGHVGTIKAQINSAHAMVIYGADEVVLVRAHSEFKGMEAELKEKGIRLLDLKLSRFAPGLEKSSRFARRPYMLIVGILGILPFVRALNREKPDVVILNLVVIPALFATIIARINAKIIVSVQGYPHFLGGVGENIPLWKKFEDIIRKKLWNTIFPLADYVLTMTESTRRKLIKNTVLNCDQVQVMHNPVIDKQVLSGLDKSAPCDWFHQSVPLILGVGRLSYQKGFDVLVKAFAKLQQAGVQAKLLILGEGEERDNLEQLINRLGISEDVKLAGYVKDPYPYIGHADLFVLSSRWEDPGHAIIEAAALKTPIVTTDCPSGPSDLVGNGKGGWVCANGDPDDMAEKMAEAVMLFDKTRVIVSSNNAEKYTLKSHYSSMNAIINS